MCYKMYCSYFSRVTVLIYKQWHGHLYDRCQYTLYRTYALGSASGTLVKMEKCVSPFFSKVQTLRKNIVCVRKDGSGETWRLIRLSTQRPTRTSSLTSLETCGKIIGSSANSPLSKHSFRLFQVSTTTPAPSPFRPLVSWCQHLH